MIVRVLDAMTICQTCRGITDYLIFCNGSRGGCVERAAAYRTLGQLNCMYFKGKPQGPLVRYRLEKQERLADDLERLEVIYQPYIADTYCVFDHVERQVLKSYGANIEKLSEEAGCFRTIRSDCPLICGRSDGWSRVFLSCFAGFCQSWSSEPIPHRLEVHRIAQIAPQQV